MKRCWQAAIAAFLLSLSAFSLSAATDPGVTLIGMGTIPGTDADLSGLDGVICQRDNLAVCINKNTMGGFGSGLAYTGHDDVFVAVPDRGPFDGRTNVPYLDRFHFLRITVDVNAAFPNVTTTLLDTRFFTNVGDEPFVGDAYAFDSLNLKDTRRFDPEGVAITANGLIAVSDEYGPYIKVFNREGRLVRNIAVPAKFLLAVPRDGVAPEGTESGDVDADGNSKELYPDFNVFGRQANRGMEGLTITPDGTKLVGIMQNALIQDSGLSGATPPGRVGLHNRILVIDVRTGTTTEHVYTVDPRPDGLPGQGRGVNEILAVNDHEFLVLERDNRSRVPTPPNDVQTPNLKRIYKIDLNKPGLTDVSGIASLPATAAQLAAAGIVPVTKTLVIDLLNPDYKVNGTAVRDLSAEKMEGLAWGPNLPDGRHVLYVISDNDLFPGLPTQIYAFAISADAGLSYDPQVVRAPVYAPGLSK